MFCFGCVVARVRPSRVTCLYVGKRENSIGGRNAGGSERWWCRYTEKCAPPRRAQCRARSCFELLQGPFLWEKLAPQFAGPLTRILLLNRPRNVRSSSSREMRISPMKYHTQPQPSKFRKCFFQHFWRIVLEVWFWSFNGCVCTVGGCLCVWCFG